jgi:hypothetical protein
VALHLSPTDISAFVAVLVAVGADTLAGVLVAVVKGTFKLSYIANFVRTSILPFVGGLLVMGLLAGMNPGQFDAPFLATAGTIGLKFLGDIVGKLQSLGLPVEAPAAAPKA